MAERRSRGKTRSVAPGVLARKRPRRSDRELVRRVLAEVLESIEGLPTPVLAKVLPVLSQAQHELESQLRRWLATKQGSDRFTAQRYRNALVQIRGALEGIERLQPAMVAGLRIGSRAAGALATRHVEQGLARFASVFEGTVQPIALDEAIILARGETLVFERFAHSAQRYAGAVGKDAVQMLAVSRAKSETIDEVTARIEGRLPRLFTKHRHAAARLARTETMNAYNVYHVESLREAAREDPEVVMRWDASFDRRRCPQCASLDGMVVDVGTRFSASWETRRASGAAMRHSATSEHPPAHPNCRCVLVPWKRGWPDWIERTPPPAEPGSTLAARAGAAATIRRAKREVGLRTT